MTPLVDKKARALAKKWQALKADEDNARTKRLAVEADIIKHFENEIPSRGTYRVDGGIKIVTGFAESWDQDALDAIQKNWSHGSGVTGFPFKVEWKPDNPAIKQLREKAPEIYEEIAPALNVVPKKPSFSKE